MLPAGAPPINLLPLGVLNNREVCLPTAFAGNPELRYLTEPALRQRKIGRDEAVAGLLYFQLHVRPALAEQGCETLRILRRNDGIERACANQHSLAAEIGEGWLRERRHRPEEHGAGENFRAEQKQGSGDVCAIRIADCIYVRRMEPIFGRCGGDKVCQFVGAADHVFLIENTLREPAEKTRHTIFQNLAARAEERGGAIKFAAEREKIRFVAASAVKKEHDRSARVFRRNIAMHKAEIVHQQDFRLRTGAPPEITHDGGAAF